MLKVLVTTVQAVEFPKALLFHGWPSTAVRSVSTNSAIARGIRRSGPASNRAQYAQPGEVRKRPLFRKQYDENTMPRFGRVDAERVRRPNHQQKQDVEDIEQSSLLKKDRLNQRQRRYLRGGRTSVHPRLHDGRKPSASSLFRSERYGRSEGRDRESSAGRRSADSSGIQYQDENFGRHVQTEDASYKTPVRHINRGGSRDKYSSRNDNSYRPSMKSNDRTERAERYASYEKPGYKTHDSDNKEALLEHRDPVSSGRGDSGYSNRENPDYTDRSSAFGTYHGSGGSSYSNSSEYATDSDKPKNRKELRSLKYGSASSGDDNSVSHTLNTPDLMSIPLYSPKQQDPMNLSMPYTTPASEFLYGTSVVLAALSLHVRKLYKLYIYVGTHREAAATDAKVYKLALAHGVPTLRMGHDFLRLMDKMSAGRPHNGYILEASPLPKLPVTSLLDVIHPNAPLTLALDHQSREDAAVNGTDPCISYSSPFPRYPLLLFLDGILDPGNLGAILRSAHFLGVDAVALSARHSAPLTPIALKASAGAAESLPLISIRTPAAFVDASRAAGWQFFAAVAPNDNAIASGDLAGAENEKQVSIPHYDLPALAALCPTRSRPCVLMLGGEGEGLRWALRRKADASVSIGASWRAGGLDSLNVSVAAGLLCEAFLRAPNEAVVDELTAAVAKVEALEMPRRTQREQKEIEEAAGALF